MICLRKCSLNMSILWVYFLIADDLGLAGFMMRFCESL